MNIALAALSCDNVTGIGRFVTSLATEFGKGGRRTTVIAQAIDAIPEGARAMPQWRPPYLRAAQKLLFSRQTRSVFAASHFDITNAFGVGRGAQIVTAPSCHRAAMEARASSTRGRLRRKSLGLFDAVSLSDENVLMTSPRPVRVIAVSRRVGNDLARYYGVPEKIIRIIPNGIYPRPVQGPRADDALRDPPSGPHNRDFTLLFIGNEFDRKGLQTIIEALSLLSSAHVRLLVAGDDDRVPYEKLSQRLGVGERVRFIGKIDDVESLFSSADAFVLPTYYEPFGMVIIEAMAAGLPVITSALAGAVEGLNHRVHGLYLSDPLSADELAGQTRQLMSDPVLRNLLAANAREASTRFHWNRIARETLSVYEEVLREAGEESP